MPNSRRLAFYLDDGLICGGAERVAHTLLSHWVDRGWEVHLISRRGPEFDFYPQPLNVTRHTLVSTYARTITTKPRTVRRWLPGRSFLRFVFEAIRLRRQLVTISPDVAVAFLTPGNAKLLAAAIGLACNVAVSERNDINAHRYTLMWRVLRRLLYPRASLVTANTPSAIGVLANYVSRDRLDCLPNPVYLPATCALASPERSQKIICAGRLVPEKRHLMLIEAFALLGDVCAGWRLDILGDGPLRDFLAEEISRRGLQNRVILHGNVHDVARYYREAAIFVLPSSYEGTSNALLEAMTHALPCIVSDSITSAQSMVVEVGAGLTFSTNVTADLARCLVTLTVAPSQRKEMGLRARQAIAASDSTAAFARWDAALLRLCRSEGEVRTRP